MVVVPLCVGNKKSREEVEESERRAKIISAGSLGGQLPAFQNEQARGNGQGEQAKLASSSGGTLAALQNVQAHQQLKSGIWAGSLGGTLAALQKR